MRAGEGGDAVYLRPKGAAALSIQQALNCWLGLPKVVCKGESHSFGLLHPLLEPQGWPFDHLSRLRVVDGTNTWADGLKLHFNITDTHAQLLRIISVFIHL